MDPFGSPLVLTKLRVPAARPRIIPRTRLVNLLTTEHGIGLLLVCAPAGYGKTTFLAEWARNQARNGVAVAWYALDEGDNAPTTFGSYLIASFIQALGPVTELVQTAQLLRSATEIDLERVLPALINRIVLSEQRCVLVLDDYHLINATAIHQAVTYLLDHLPENLTIATGSRSIPPLPLARQRARGKLVEIRTANLRFKADEATQFLNKTMQLDLSPKAAAALAEHTEGWIAGLQLAALSLSSREAKSRATTKEEIRSAFSGDHRYLAEYLLEEVINQLPVEVQAFLLATAVLERMCAPLCEAVSRAAAQSGITTERGRSSENILKQLEHSNLFLVSLDEQGEWFRYHHLFRDFLLRQLKRAMPDQVPVLHRAACEWYTEKMLLREAAYHAFQTQDWEYAAAFVEAHSFTMIIHNNLSTVYEWCAAFPEEVMQRHPMLCILQCWALVFTFRLQNRERVEKRLRQAEQAIAAIQDAEAAALLTEHADVVRTYLGMMPDPAIDSREQIGLAQNRLAASGNAPASRFSALLTMGYAFLALHEVRPAGDALRQARETALSAKLYTGIVESTYRLARLAHCQGELQRAADLCRQGQADITALMSHTEQPFTALGNLEIAWGCAVLEQGNLEEAEERMTRGLEIIGWGANPDHLFTACEALYRIHIQQGRAAEALAILTRLETAWPDIAFFTHGVRAAQALRSTPEDGGALANARGWSQKNAPGETWSPPGMGPFGAADVYYRANKTWIQLQIALGRPETAKPFLEQMLAASESHGLKTRVSELSALRAQIQATKEGEHAVPTAVDRLVVPGVFATPGVLNEPLSEREVEVLQLIAGGASNQDIAERLVISVGTVKSHVNHILGKLSARNRTEAAARAREWGLLG